MRVAVNNTGNLSPGANTQIEGSKLRHQLEPFDLVGFIGEGNLSRLIRVGAKYDSIKYGAGFKYSECLSHVGLVSIDRNILESTTLNTEPPIRPIGHTEPVNGVSIVDFGNRVQNFNGRVVVFPLRVPLTADQKSKYRSFQDEVIGRPYEQDKRDLLNAQFFDFIRVASLARRLKHKRENENSIFCSELVGMALERINFGVESEGVNATPMDLLIRARYSQIWDFNNPVRLSNG